MATFDSTLGGSTANSYISLAEADSVFDFSMQETAWDAFSDAEKQAALVQATFWLETVKFSGTRCSPSSDDDTLPQSLQWPRSDASCDGVAAACTFIPKEIKQATAFLALNLATSPDSITGPIGGGTEQQSGVYVKKNKLGDLEQEFAEYSRENATNDCNTCSTPEVIARYPWLRGILSCWADISSSGGKVILRVRS